MIHRELFVWEPSARETSSLDMGDCFGDWQRNYSLVGYLNYVYSARVSVWSVQEHLKRRANQSFTDLEQNVGVVQASAVILPAELHMGTGLGVFPGDVVILSVVGDGSDRRREGAYNQILPILPHFLSPGSPNDWPSIALPKFPKTARKPRGVCKYIKP